ncbi:hypothetical protein DB32_006726 [Sandaracinus amylolyticus]|uniref:Uncharacterized protein n=2 Tax=Sandaracinus amylolyticus TaxID=927083 RepID=A0A0F6W7X6_9BACT|nr:hypothetical protein DB32_006726 [Sandaracinus amylolyticus]
MLWLALLIAQGIFVLLLAVPLVELPSARPDDTLLAVLVAVATSSAIASFLLPQHFLRAALARHRFEMREVPDPSAPVGFRGAAPTIREHADVAAVHRIARMIGTTPFILSIAFSESISVIGFASAFLGHPPIVWGAFIATGIALTALRFPTDATFFGPIERHTGVPVPR